MTPGLLRNLVRCIVIASLCMLAAAAAHALTPAELQRLLQASPRPSVRFQETRESPWLSAPLTSRGTMRSTPGVLEKRVESPRQETWRLLADRIEWQGAAAVAPRKILFSEAPALAALADVMRRILAGDIEALQRDFEVKVSGNPGVWRAQLKPRSPQVTRHIDEVELQGTGGAVQVLIVVERQGERTTTRLEP